MLVSEANMRKLPVGEPKVLSFCVFLEGRREYSLAYRKLWC